jgi:thioredoxin-related protein
MRKLLLGLAFLGLTGLSIAKGKGIKFESGQSWEQIKSKAKAENKYIFMDVFATWCGPCKAMDRDVYPDERLGTFMNERFISVKVQADTLKADGDEIKDWYADARQIIKDNKVNGFPTLLFFTPQGKLVDRGVGFTNLENLLILAGNARDPLKQYYTLLEQYNQGNRNYRILPDLIRKAKSLGENEATAKMADDYLHNYLDKLPEKDLLTKEQLLFATIEIGDFFTSASRIFQFIYKHSNRVDSIVGEKDFAKSIIGWRITKEELYNKLWANDNQPIAQRPDWEMIRNSIKEKYGEYYADSLITPAQFLFYKVEKRSKEYVKVAEIIIKKYPPKKNGNRLSTAIGGDALRGPANDAWGLNEIAWTTFQNSDDPTLLKKAIYWSDLSIKLEDEKSSDAHQFYDTKANLLYKLGRIKEAIEAEQTAIKVVMSCNTPQSLKDLFVTSYKETIAKIKKGVVTWPENKLLTKN